jgi:hypothetical protein
LVAISDFSMIGIGGLPWPVSVGRDVVVDGGGYPCSCHRSIEEAFDVHHLVPHHECVQGGHIAAALAATGFVALGVFQLVLALGAPLGHAAWGGDTADLTSAQRLLGSAVSVVLNASAAAVVLARVGLTRWPRSRRLLRWVWVPKIRIRESAS